MKIKLEIESDEVSLEEIAQRIAHCLYHLQEHGDVYFINTLIDILEGNYEE